MIANPATWLTKTEEREEIIKMFLQLPNWWQWIVIDDDDDDDEDGDGSKVWDNLRQKLVPKENKVVSKNLEKAYIQLAAERNPFLVAGHMIVCKLSDLVVSFSMSFGSNDCIIMNALQKRNYLVLLFFGSI